MTGRRNRKRLLPKLVALAVLLVIAYFASLTIPVVVATFRFSQAMDEEVLHGEASEAASLVHGRLVAAAYRLGLEVSGAGQTAEGPLPELEGIYRRACPAGGGCLQPGNQDMRIQYPVVHPYGYAVPELHEIAPLVAVGLGHASGGSHQRVYLAPRAPAHQQHIGLTTLDGVDKLIELGQRQRGPGAAHGYHLVSGRLSID